MIAIVPVGPRGSGKSTFFRRMSKMFPHITVLSRDEFIFNEYGARGFEIDEAYDFALAKGLDHLGAVRKNGTRIVVFDYYSESAYGRFDLINTLRDFGASKIVSAYFTTPREACVQWFQHKPDVPTRISESNLRMAYEYYHHLAETIDRENFDRVIRINPVTMSPTEFFLSLPIEPVFT